MMRTLVLSLFVVGSLVGSTSSALAQNPRCNSLFRITQTQRSWDEVDKLVMMTFNVANIYGLRGKFRRISATDFIPIYDKPAKPKDDMYVQQLKDVMNEVSPDIAVLTEVESLSALKKLSTEIASPYKSFLIEGNDMRGIDIGFLVKSDLPINGEIFSHKYREWKDPISGRKIPLFSRDLPVLVLRKDNETKPFLMVFGMHAISQRGRPGDDQSLRLREAQFAETLKIIAEFRAKYGNDIPLIVAGDFNTDVLTAPELQALRDVLISAFDVAQKTIPRAARVTHTFHEKYEETDGTTHERTSMTQLDDIRLLGINPDAVLSAIVYRYKDVDGQPRRFALSREERREQTSDHLPVVVEISRDAFK